MEKETLERLKEYVGKEIEVEVIEYQELKIVSGILEEIVNDFLVKIEGKMIPFEGFGIYIKRIKVKCTEKVLYERNVSFQSYYEIFQTLTV